MTTLTIIAGVIIWIVYVMQTPECEHLWEDQGEGHMKCTKCKKRHTIRNWKHD